jgi:hypothetical protein
VDAKNFQPVSANARELLAQLNPDALVADGHDDALIGVLLRPGKPPVACYDREKLIEGLQQQGLDWDDAVEWFEFNVIGAYVGEATPVYADVRWT